MKRFRKLSRAWRKWFRDFQWPAVLSFRFYWAILDIPFQWLINNWRERRLRDLLYGTPAILGIMAIPLCLARLEIQERSLSQTYFTAAEVAFQAKDFPRAELLLTRVLNRPQGSETSDARFLMAVLMEETERKERATELFRMLAPDDKRGHRASHRRIAMLLANDIDAGSSPIDIQRLHWHLLSSDADKSPEMALAWGRYSLAILDLEAAHRYFKIATDRYPELWQTLGAIEFQTGNTNAAISSFERSSVYLHEQLDQDPNDERIRINYAEVLMKLGRLDDARLVLEQGQRLQPDGRWQWLLASLAVGYHDLKSTQQTPLSELLGYLDTALKYEPNHGPALQRLMAYATANVEGNIELKTILARVVAEGEQPALAHLAMGNLCWIENDRKGALFHFERASSIRDDFAVILNNLAWLISHDDKNPDFDRALALVNVAIEEQPDNASFLDTRGTIHFLRKEWKPALDDLEKALSGVRDKRAVHEKLASIYQELGMKEISEQHQVLFQQIKERPVVPR